MSAVLKMVATLTAKGPAPTPAPVPTPPPRRAFTRPDGSLLIVEGSPQFGNVRLWAHGSQEIVTIPAAQAAAVARAILEAGAAAQPAQVTS